MRRRLVWYYLIDVSKETAIFGMYSEYGCSRFLRSVLFVPDCTASRYREQYFAEVISDKFVTGVLPSAESTP